jgi:hypothetical protein
MSGPVIRINPATPESIRREKAFRTEETFI